MALPDMVRAFALTGIALINVAYFAYPADTTYYDGGLNHSLDLVTWFGVEALLFSLVFCGSNTSTGRWNIFCDPGPIVTIASSATPQNNKGIRTLSKVRPPQSPCQMPYLQCVTQVCFIHV